MQHQANNKYEQELLENPALYHQMVYVPGGTFMMGSDDIYNEKPLHKIRISPFYMAKYQVTQSLYLAVIGTQPPFNQGGLTCPVQLVTWHDAQDFCTELNKRCGYALGQGYRLPTEAEWEYAAKGGSEQANCQYAGSSLLDEVGWYDDNNDENPKPVGLLLPNNLDLYDMSGNVWEWCNDWYAVRYDLRKRRDPKGPIFGQRRVSRGGDFWSPADYCHPSARKAYPPVSSDHSIGFRLAFTL